MVITVVLGAAAAGALIAGAVAWFLPNFDPAAPHASEAAIAREVDKVEESAEQHPRVESYLRSRVDPTRLTGLALTVASALLVLGAVAVGALLVMVQRHAALAHYDLTAARWGGTNATPRSTQMLRDISQLGGTDGVILIALITAIAQYRRTRTAAVFAFLTIVVGGQFLVANLIKEFVGRARPDIHQLTGFSGSSFPSGHATAAAATFAAVALLVGRGRSRRTKAFLAAGAAFVAVGIATTRVLLGVHWFTDVLAGLAVGWAWFALASIAFGGRVLHFGQPVEAAKETAEVDAAARAAETRQPAPVR